MPVISGSCSPGHELYRSGDQQTSQGCPNSCAGCGGRIVDRFYLLAVDRQWHVNCLKCCECKSQLDSEFSCFARDGNIYCKDDYYRLFAVKRCARCQRGIFASELVMRARDLVYHLHCFTCAWCNAALTQGDYFGLRDNLVYCRAHYELLVHGETFTPAPAATAPLTPLSQDSRCSPPLPTAPFQPYQHVQHPTQGGSVRKGRPRKRKTVDGTGSDATHPIGVSSLDPGMGMHALTPLESAGGGGTGGGSLHGQQRTKRMRTSFKHHQLRTMKSYFAINQNPDAKDLKQLAQKTGLSKRVLQVWFQNARAKWRRNNLKQQDSQHHHPHHPHHGGGGGGSGGGPCSPGAVSSFSEASPIGPDAAAPGTPHQSHGLTPPLTALDYSAGAGGDSMQHISSLQELF